MSRVSAKSARKRCPGRRLCHGVVRGKRPLNPHAITIRNTEWRTDISLPFYASPLTDAFLRAIFIRSRAKKTAFPSAVAPFVFLTLSIHEIIATIDYSPRSSSYIYLIQCPDDPRRRITLH